MQSLTKEKNKTGTKRSCPTTDLTSEDWQQKVDSLENRIKALEEGMEALIEDILDDYSKQEEEVEGTQDYDNTEQ